jgi:hypothetical protein
LNKPAVAIAATPDSGGYWLAGADGGVFAYGDARFFGSPSGGQLNAPIVSMAATSTGNGYWLVAADGGVFAYGDAAFLGAPAGLPLNRPIVGMAATPNGRGYWLVAADGGVFAYGEAGFLGSPSGAALNAAVAGIASTSDGRGYWLVAGDGGVFAYGDAGWFGSPAGLPLNDRMIGMAPTWDGDGYWLMSADGGVFAYGDANWYGGVAGRHLNQPMVGIASGLAAVKPQVRGGLQSAGGWDISWPQCGGAVPSAPYGFGIVGVTGGKAMTQNPCLAEQYRWAQQEGSGAGLYVNVSPAPAGTSPYGWGAATVIDAVDYAGQAAASAPTWWLDVETTNGWGPDRDANAEVVRGAVDELQRHHIGVGVYSTGLQWRMIAGGYSPGVPVWVAGAPNDGSAGTWCSPDHGFGGGPVYVVQALPVRFDANTACQPAIDRAGSVFDLPLTGGAPAIPTPTGPKPL